MVCKPPKFIHTYPGAKYVTARHKAYNIKQDGDFWRAVPYRGGPLPKELRGYFQTFDLCEQALINYVKKRDPLRKAVYPGASRRN